MFKIIKNEKTPISIKKYLYDVSRDGTVTYLEWFKFDTMYGLYMSTHKENIDFSQSACKEDFGIPYIWHHYQVQANFSMLPHHPRQ